MDGTLLDLHFDSHFWLEHLPKTYAGIKGISEEQGKEYMMAEYRQVFGTIAVSYTHLTLPTKRIV